MSLPKEDAGSSPELSATDLPRYYLYLNDNGELTAQLSDEAMQVCIIRTLTALKTLIRTKENEAYRKGYDAGQMDEAERGITI